MHCLNIEKVSKTSFDTFMTAQEVKMEVVWESFGNQQDNSNPTILRIYSTGSNF